MLTKNKQNNCHFHFRTIIIEAMIFETKLKTE